MVESPEPVVRSFMPDAHSLSSRLTPVSQRPQFFERSHYIHLLPPTIRQPRLCEAPVNGFRGRQEGRPTILPYSPAAARRRWMFSMLGHRRCHNNDLPIPGSGALEVATRKGDRHPWLPAWAEEAVVDRTRLDHRSRRIWRVISR